VGGWLYGVEYGRRNAGEDFEWLMEALISAT
jgi:hypothetical protein